MYSYVNGFRALGIGLVGLSLLILSSCAKVPDPGQTLEFDICAEALATLPKRGGYQGYNGWFYFNHDLKETYPTYEEADFIAEMNEALRTQNIALVAVPLPGLGISSPEFLYREDSWQTTFSPETARANYEAFIRTLRAQGVEVVDALAVIEAYNQSGGQTFFKRDVHWRPEAAQVISEEIAQVVKRVTKIALPSNPTTLSTRTSRPFHGEHINSWTSELCGYRMPSEPLTDFVVKPAKPITDAEVIQAGTSFSVPPFDVGFLGAALQSSVLNVSIGGGGMFFPLETYLKGDLYLQKRPSIIVWEFPVSIDVVVPPQQRRLIAAVYGICGDDRLVFEESHRLGTQPVRTTLPSLETSQTYLTFSFSDLDVLEFDLDLRYGDARTETLFIHHGRSDRQTNRGRYFTTLAEGAEPLREISLRPPSGSTGTVKLQLCRTP